MNQIALDLKRGNRPNTKPRIFWSQTERELMARAIIAELLSHPDRMFDSWPTIAARAQDNQLKILLGNDFGNPEVSWPARNLLSNDLMRQELNLAHAYLVEVNAAAGAVEHWIKVDAKQREELQQLREQLQTVQLRLRDEVESVAAPLRARVTALESENHTLRNRKQPLSNYSDDEIVREYHARMHARDMRMMSFVDDGQILLAETRDTLAQATSTLREMLPLLQQGSGPLFEITEQLHRLTTVSVQPHPHPTLLAPNLNGVRRTHHKSHL